VFPSTLEAPQLVQSSTGQQQAVQVPISLIAVQPDVSTGQHQEGDFTFFHPERTVAYTMCGFGDTQQNCGVATATGADPAGLFHREALELALYTLKYVPGTDAVITYLHSLPPRMRPQRWCSSHGRTWGRTSTSRSSERSSRKRFCSAQESRTAATSQR